MGVFHVDSGDDERVTQATIRSDVEITVYRTKKQAEVAQERAGGIILEVDAKGLIGLNEFGKDVLLSRNDDRERAGTSTTAAICVACVGELIPNYGPFETGTVKPQGEIMKFASEEQAWLDEFEGRTGFRLFQ